MTTNDETPRIYSGPFLRTLHALERTLRRHLDELRQIDCEDVEAAEAIVFAIEAAQNSLDHTQAARRQHKRD
jgi:hypothetical protein